MRSFFSSCALLLALSLFFGSASAGCRNMLPYENAPAHGFVVRALLEVADQFRENCIGRTNFSYEDQTGLNMPPDNAQLTVYRKDCIVVNLWCGSIYANGSVPIQENSLIPTFSVAKAVVATGLTMLHSQGRFGWKHKVSAHWPEFAQNGKENITVEQLFGNSAGLPYIGTITIPDLALDSDFTVLKGLLETQAPIWTPGTQTGYSPIVWGWYAKFFSQYVDVQSRPIAQFLKEELFDEIGAEFHFGIRPNETDVRSRVAELRFGTFAVNYDPSAQLLNAALADPTSFQFRALFNPVELAFDPTILNVPAGQNIDLPAGVAWTSAKSLATILRRGLRHPFSTVGGVNRATATSYYGTDASTFGIGHYTPAGFTKMSPTIIYSDSDDAFGHTGASGTFCYVDPDNKITFAYLTANYSPVPATAQHELPYNTFKLVDTLNEELGIF